MFSRVIGHMLCALFVGTSGGVVFAAQVDLPVRYEYYRSNYVLNDDASSQEAHEWSMKVLKASALDWAKQTSISYSTSVQQADVIEAYTKKADGRRVDVPKDNYQYRFNEGKDKSSPVFSDYASLTVVFPDLSVGDSVVFSYRVKQTEAIFPGHFSIADTFSRQAAFDEVRVSFEYPQSLWIQHRNTGMTETFSVLKNGHNLLEWRYANKTPETNPRQDFSVYDPDSEVGYAVSTFKSYEEIAQAYGKRALLKAEVSERIKALADEVIAGKTQRREQARVLYEWVATQITYGGNCVGVGAVVPHDLSFVLDNKMGDCKDHATLLQALLKAVGIASHQVLINAGSVYRLPRLPIVANVNHVINYLPEFDLYVDSTADNVPFGMLPASSRGKPVLHVDQTRAGAHTPVPKLASDQRIVSHLKIDPEGTLSGTVEVFLKGDGAVWARDWARKITRNDEEDLVKNLFRGRGISAVGVFEKDDPTELTDHYRYKISIERAEKVLRMGSSSAFALYPLMSGGIYQHVPSGLEPEVEAESTCSSRAVSEEYVIVLPAKMKVLSIPKNLNVETQYQAYDSSYRLKKNVLTAKRAFSDTTPAIVCSPPMLKEFIKFGAKVTENLKEQILYK